MYTFQPLIDTSSSHGGAYFTLVISILILAGALYGWWEDREVSIGGMIGLIVVGLFTYLVYNVSYTPDHPKNEQVIATLVTFQPEGYNERSGKTRSDHHYMYVVYAVEGQQVILQAHEGLTYPPRAILYKN